MSKDIELRHILPNGHHRSSSSSDKMSGSGSFRSSPPHDILTDTVSTVPPVYSTVPEAQAEHSRYNAQQVKNAHAVPPPQTEYTSPVGMDEPNEYDMIPDNNKRRENRSLSPGVAPGVAPLMADNVLYGAPVDEKLKHRSLTMEKANSEGKQRRFTGSTSSHMVVKEPSDGGGLCTGRCCGVCLMLVLVFVVAFLAVAALVLVLSIMFQIYPVCDCTKTQEFQALQTQVNELLRNMPTQAPEDSGMQELIRSINSTLNGRVDTLRSDIESNLARINDGSFLIGTNFSSTLSGINVFETCETRIEQTCNISVPTSGTIYPTPCLTNEIAVNLDGKYTLDMKCIRAAETMDGGNALVGFLSFGQSFFGDEVAVCHCHVVVDDVSNQLEHNVTCGIQVTRCASSQTLNITTELVG